MVAKEMGFSDFENLEKLVLFGPLMSSNMAYRALITVYCKVLQDIFGGVELI